MVNESNKDIIDTDTEKKVSDSDPYFQEPSKQAKYQFNSSMLDDQSDDIPFHFCQFEVVYDQSGWSITS